MVGVDGSPSGHAAAAWAAVEAEMHNRSLVLVYGYAWPTYASAGRPAWGPAADAGTPAGGSALLDEAAAVAVAAAPAVRFTVAVAAGTSATVLLERSENAAMIVVGRRGSGGFVGLLLGSTAAQVAAYARCPVVVVPEQPTAPHADGPGVVLGVDEGGARGSATALALEESSLRKRPLTAVRAWYFRSDDPAIVPSFPPLPADHVDEQRRLVHEALAGHTEDYPDVEVRTEIAHHLPARALLEASAGADLLVVGSRGAGGFLGLRIGSVADAVLRHATCPVAVVPAARP